MSEPPSSSARSRSPTSPYPPPGSASSGGPAAGTGAGGAALRTSTSSAPPPGAGATRTATRAPGACLRTLLRDSWTTRKTAHSTSGGGAAPGSVTSTATSRRLSPVRSRSAARPVPPAARAAPPSEARSTPTRSRSSSRARTPWRRMLSAVSRFHASSVSAARRAPDWTAMMPTWWAMVSCISRASRARSRATARSASSRCSRARVAVRSASRARSSARARARRPSAVGPVLIRAAASTLMSTSWYVIAARSRRGHGQADTAKSRPHAAAVRPRDRPRATRNIATMAGSHSAPVSMDGSARHRAVAGRRRRRARESSAAAHTVARRAVSGPSRVSGSAAATTTRSSSAVGRRHLTVRAGAGAPLPPPAPGWSHPAWRAPCSRGPSPWSCR
ncbi:hypothetical protein BG846_04623 [Streptomyces fradiae ATCC 10745 = DSM 40063]|uniref:Uncharacterized protein n=1 Tax=Streptomyces fradiae ATCC 10745 = DSM 40063 TaxID=1319510 RepID=A0A1Y2NQX4_STRFR|nr:hypothetical protein BG846_04623 [Streptomyces fradiae ATCC 10745 = DSM 40063]